MSLSDVACRNAQPREKPYKLGDSGGLFLRIMPSGSKLWQMKYRYGGKEKKLSLGQYPEISLLQAREGRDKGRKLLTANQDPSLVKQEERRMAAASAADSYGRYPPVIGNFFVSRLFDRIYGSNWRIDAAAPPIPREPERDKEMIKRFKKMWAEADASEGI